MPVSLPEAPNTTRYPGHAPRDEFMEINPDPEMPLPSQVEVGAINRFDENDLAGGALAGGAWEQDDLIHVISSHEQLHEMRDVPVMRDLGRIARLASTIRPLSRTRLARPHVKHGRPRWNRGQGGYGATPYTQKKKIHQTLPYLEREVVREKRDHTTDVYVIDTYNKNGELLKMERFFNSELAEKLNSLNYTDPSKPNYVKHFRWLEKPAPAAAELSRTDISRINIPRLGETKTFDQIMQHQRELKDRGDGRFEDWVGLTWNAKGRDGIEKWQIVRDTLVGANGSRVRVWIARAYDRNNRIVNRKTFEDNEFREYLEEAEKNPDKRVSDLHWEVPQDTGRAPRRPDQLSWAGWVAANHVIGAMPPAPSIRDRKLSYRLLSGQDINYSGSLIDPASKAAREAAAELSDYARKNPQFRETLAQTIAEFGGPESPTLFTLVSDLRNNYLSAVRRLGLPAPAPEKASISSIVWAMVKERYAAQNPDSVTAKFTYTWGIEGKPADRAAQAARVDPFGISIAAQAKRRKIVDYAVAAEFMANAFDEKVIPTPKFVKLPRERGDKVRYTQDYDWGVQYELKNEVNVKLQKFIKDDVMAIVKPVVEGRVKPAKLSLADMEKLGRLLREQFIQ